VIAPALADQQTRSSNRLPKPMLSALPTLTAACLGSLSYLSVAGQIPGYFSLLALLMVFGIAHRQKSRQAQGGVLAGYFFTVNLLVAGALFALYTVEAEAILKLYGLVVVYLVGLVVVTTVTFPRQLTVPQILLFATSTTLFDRALSDPSLLHNWAVPLSHGYYIFFPEIFGLYAQLGMYGATFVIYAVLLLGLRVWYRHRSAERVLFVISLVGLVWFSNLMSHSTPSGQLSVNVIQPGIVGEDSHFVERTQDFMRNVLPSQLRTGVLNVLPESSLFVYSFDTDRLRLRRYDNLLLGGVIRNQALVYNSAVLLQNGEITARYNKKFLVPVEEDRWLQDGNERQTNTFLFGDVKLGIGICYESSFQSVGLNAVRNGAKAFLVLSNTQSEAATALQLRSVQVRAAETGRAFLFAAMAGKSSLVDTTGHSIQTMRWAESEYEVVSMPLYSTATNVVERAGLVDKGLGIIECGVLLFLLGNAVFGVSISKRI
jgi:apolipoprotein N-acyltransferase